MRGGGRGWGRGWAWLWLLSTGQLCSVLLLALITKSHSGRLLGFRCQSLCLAVLKQLPGCRKVGALGVALAEAPQEPSGALCARVPVAQQLPAARVTLFLASVTASCRNKC